MNYLHQFLICFVLTGFQQEGMSDSAAVHTEHYLSDNEPTDSPLVLAVKNSEPLVATENRSNGMASRAVYLSNRDRLLLRKQALKMKKRPVLAVGDFYYLFNISCFPCF